MKRHWKFLILVLALAAIFAFTACGGGDDNGGTGGTTPTTPVATPPPEGDLEEVVHGDPRLVAHGLELVEFRGETVLRFTDTRNVSVIAWNRSPDRLPHITESYWTDWISREVLEMHNIAINFVEVDRWTESDVMGALLMANNAPDVSMMFDFQPVLELAGMGGIHDLGPLVSAYRDFIPNFYEMQGTEMVWWNRDPVSGNLWAFTGRHFAGDLRMATFVREDWLNALNISPPTSHAEFEAMLIAFRDNAELLLGADAAQMIPFQPSQDIGWRGDHVMTSFMPNDITHREHFVRGFDDRRFTQPGIKEGARVLNRWFNEGLMWQDFSLHDANDPLGDDLIMLGFVGSFIGNWDYPFRTSPGVITQLRYNVGPEANFIAVAPFENDAGVVRMEVGHGQERHIFLPHTNTEPIASLLYIDFISRPDVREFIMFGYEGIHFEMGPDGYLIPIDNDLWPDEMFIPSLRNFDLLPTFTNIPPLSNPALNSLAFGFEGIEQDNVNRTIELTRQHAWVPPRVVVREIVAEGLYGGALDGMFGMGNEVLNQAINASPADFDAVFDAGMERYMAAGGRAIMEEREIAWVETFGDVDWLTMD
ncbi:MAG: hypothetical protein FWF79_10645 [Defluviitaleaceae bacterium]|nr:hypothetical protein [Defluviitaleaceae bacterium]